MYVYLYIIKEEIVRKTGEANMNDLELYREQLALCDDKIIDALGEGGMIKLEIVANREV